MWAKMIREPDPTLSNDPHKKKRRMGNVINELNVRYQHLNGNKVKTHNVMMDSFMAGQKMAKDDLANQNNWHFLISPNGEP